MHEGTVLHPFLLKQRRIRALLRCAPFNQNESEMILLCQHQSESDLCRDTWLRLRIQQGKVFFAMQCQQNASFLQNSDENNSLLSMTEFIPARY